MDLKTISQSPGVLQELLCDDRNALVLLTFPMLYGGNNLSCTVHKFQNWTLRMRLLLSKKLCAFIYISVKISNILFSIDTICSQALGSRWYILLWLNPSNITITSTSFRDMEESSWSPVLHQPTRHYTREDLR